MALGDAPQSEECLRQALAIEPGFAPAHFTLGNLLRRLGRLEEAEQSYRGAVALRPDIAITHHGLALTLTDLGRLDEAEQSYRAALKLDPTLPQAHSSLGNALWQLGRLEEAEQRCRRAIELDPNFAAAYNNLGLAVMELGRFEQAEQSYLRAIALEPTLYEAHTNLGLALTSVGRLEEAEQSIRKALSLNPRLAVAHSNLALLLNYMPNRSPAAIYAQHVEFGRTFREIAPPAGHCNTREPERRLRIGYVSPDLRQHAVAFFIEPILASHDAREFEVTCYSNSPSADETTKRLRSCAQHWRDVFGVGDGGLATLIRDDAIDILVDLSGHTANNRLLAFAHQPAPVQATWLGYLNTTGLDAMGWRITDARAAPEGLLERFHTESLLRLPDSQWCYRAPDHSPDVAPAPMLDAGFCTFAAFSTAAKVNAQVIDLWSRLLERVPRSRLLIVVSRMGSIPEQYRKRFAECGIDEKRLDLMPSKSFRDYLALHNRVDVMLDTFPYTGGTTTCHALWMGVPVVSLVGETATSRGGASLLYAVGLADLVARSPEEYLDIAAGLAANPERLASLRTGMRERMNASPLMDATRFTRNLENAYRTMWRTWCETRGGS
jgi:protein O-GlcNAc transferase